MARFYGPIGFAITEETSPGIYEEKYTERYYKGDVLRSNRRWEPSEYLNDNFSVNNDISIVADDFANTNLGTMRYVYWMKQYYEITSATVDTEKHRITLSIGGVFNVESGTATPASP